MTDTPPTRSPIAGGFLLMLSLLAGAFIGATRGQPSLGFVIGLGVGIALVALIWVIDRARR